MLRRLLLASVFFVGAPVFAQSQPAQEISLCELRQNAQAFDHKVIRVRGGVDLQFEDFTLYDSQCKDEKSTSVWLTFGGDVSDIATYCCGDHSRVPGHDLEIDGRAIELLKDASYDEFYKLLRASRNRMPDGEPCVSDCRLYRVSATLTGLFLAKKGTATEFAGYGHLGCCSLLIIQQVSEVSAERTAVPLGTFDCKKSVWHPGSKEASELTLYCASNCTRTDESAITHVAAHWNDTIAVSSGSTQAYTDNTGPRPIEHLSWISDNLQTSYNIVGEETSSPNFTVTREVCSLTRPDVATSQGIFCDDYASSSDFSPERQREYERLIDAGDDRAAEKMVVDSAEQLSSKGDQSWRTKTLRDAAHAILIRGLKEWAISGSSDVRFDKCTTPETLGDWKYSSASCMWYSPDGMQQFSVTLMRRDQAQHVSARSPWLLHDATGRICHPDASLTTANIHTHR